MGYPPVEHLLAVLVSCGDEELLDKGCHYLREYALRVSRNVKPADSNEAQMSDGQGRAAVIGPASPGIDKVKDIYRRVLYIKAPEYDTLTGIKNRLEQYIEINSGFDKMRIQFDFDPMGI